MLIRMVNTQNNFKPESLCMVTYKGVLTDFNRSRAFLFGGNDMSKFIRRDKAPLCACGCRERVKKSQDYKGWNKFILGHSRRGKKHSEEAKKKIALAAQNISAETRLKLSIAAIGRQFSAETRLKLSIAAIGKPKSDEHRRKIGIAKQNISDETKLKMSIAHIGRQPSDEIKQKLSIAMSGINHHNWQGGIAHEPYCQIWLDKEYKESIRERDNHTCQNPDCWKNCNLHPALSLHHINYNKKDCHPKNIITLCRGCNIRANKNKEQHTEFYQQIMTKKYGYQYN